MLDEFDLDSYKLKPINKGLGFHEKEQVRWTTRSSLKTNLEKRLERENPVEEMDSLKAFYSMPRTDIKRMSKKKIPKKKEAEASLQFSAWLLDVIFVGIIVCVTVLGFGLSAYVVDRASLEMVIVVLTRMDGLVGVGVLFGITYLLYFTYADITSSLGKKFSGIKLVAKSGKALTSRMTLVRSLITIFSLVLLGIPILFDMQGKLSDTKIIKV